MPYPYEPSRSHRKGLLGQWLPLAVTVTAVSIGIAAWIWSERRDTDNDDGSDSHAADHNALVGDRKDQLDAHNRDVQDTRHVQEKRQDATSQSDPPVLVLPPNDTLYARVTDVVRRTPSPQQILGDTGRRVAASVGAAFGIGKTLDFRDHEAWQEEAEMSAAAALVGPEEEEEVTLSRQNDEPGHGILAGSGVANQKRVGMQKKTKASIRRRMIVAVVSAADPLEDAAGMTAGQVCLDVMLTVSSRTTLTYPM